jgi:hypothetical protein
MLMEMAQRFSWKGNLNRTNHVSVCHSSCLPHCKATLRQVACSIWPSFTSSMPPCSNPAQRNIDHQKKHVSRTQRSFPIDLELIPKTLCVCQAFGHSFYVRLVLDFCYFCADSLLRHHEAGRFLIHRHCCIILL